MRRRGLRTLCSVLVAATTMSLAIPAFAEGADDMPQTIEITAETAEVIEAQAAVISDDMLLGALPVIEEVPEDQEEDHEDQAAEETSNVETAAEDQSGTGSDTDSEWVIPTDKEVKDNNEQEKKAAEQKAAEEKKMNDLINEAGKQAGAIVVKMMNGGYSNPSEVVEDISLSAIKFVNENFVKSIPYVGTFMNTIINGAVSGEQTDPLNARLDTINDSINEVNKTIKACTNELINRMGDIVRNGKIGKMNAANTALMNLFSASEADFASALYIMGMNDAASDSSVNLKAACKYFESIHDKRDHRALYDAYFNYCNEIMTAGTLMTPDNELEPDLFNAFRKIAIDKKNGAYAIMEYAEGRNALVKSVSETSQYGYDMLDTIISTELEYQRELKKSTVEAINDLRANASDSAEIQNLMNSTITSLNLQDGECFGTISALEKDLSNLRKKKAEMDAYITREKDKIAQDEAAFSSYHPATSVTVHNNVYGTHDFQIKMKDNTIVTKTGYPVYNKEKNQIEYRDRFGNMIGKRSVGTSLKEVDQYNVKVGRTYIVSMGAVYANLLNRFTPTCLKSDNVFEVKVSRVFEDPAFLGSVRTIEGVDIDRNRNSTYSIGGRGTFNVYEYPVGDPVVAFE